MAVAASLMVRIAFFSWPFLAIIDGSLTTGALFLKNIFEKDIVPFLGAVLAYANSTSRACVWENVYFHLIPVQPL